MANPTIDPELRALMDETLADIRRGKLQPDPIEPWWEMRRLNELTPDYLGRVLEEAGLAELAANARAAHYDDYSCPAEVADGLETIRLVRDLRRARASASDPERIDVIENAVRRGEFDATQAESDRWAASKSGQDAFGALVDSAAKTPKVGRNDPCWCGSGEKFKRCCGR